MRSYGQYCAVARALDLIGDRWTLLIVRELLLRGPSRYTDLREGLPGIATNLLADRLRELGDLGLVAREDTPPPIAATLFRLTPRGEELRPVVTALGQWGIPLMADPPRGDEFRPYWLSLPVALYLSDSAPEKPPVAIEVRTGAEPVVIETADGVVRTRAGTANDPDVVLSGAPELIAAVLTGSLALKDAVAKGLKLEGDRASLRRLLPA
jgi:DNA-binding HxlR family transcriptional regulator